MRPVPVLSLVLVAVMHVLFALLLWFGMQSKPAHPAVADVGTDQALVVTLIDHPGKPRTVQPPEPPPLPAKPVPPRQAATARVRPAVHEQPHHDAMVVQDHEAAPAPAASVATPSASSLFTKGGAIRLPSAAETPYATSNAKTEPAKPADDSRIMVHDSNRMHYKATRFEKYFPPPNETAGGALGRHVGDVIKKVADSVCDPHKRSTATNLLCGVAPPPPSPKDGDERLNLPPAPLAHDPNPPKAPSLASCIAEYKAIKPLSYGCPVNTPDLAFKAEVDECIGLYRAGKRLKTWCPADTPARAAAESTAPAASPSTGSH